MPTSFTETGCSVPLESEVETLLCPVSRNPWQPPVFTGHLAKSSRQTSYLLKRQDQQPRKDILPDRMLYLHQSSQNSSFSSVTVAPSEERSTSPPPSALWSALWPGSVGGTSKAMLLHMAAVLLPGQGAQEKARVAAGGRPQPCNSAFIEVTPLPRLLPSMLGCSFIRTPLQLPSWTSHPSKEDKRG